MKILSKCDLCGSGKLKFLYKIEDYVGGVEGVFDLYQCKNCGLMFLNPQPSFEELDYAFYAYPKIESGESPYHLSCSPREYKIVSKFRRKLYAFSMKYFFVETFLFSSFSFFAFVRGIKIIPNGKYLDVGCGGGQFLFEIKMLNPSGEYYGVEPGNFDEEDVKEHGLNVFKGTLEEAHYPDDHFDVITMNSVFEHVPNPSEIIKELKRVLKPNGVLIIAVPNYNSFARKLFGKCWSYFGAQHVFIFSSKNMKAYAEKFNLKTEKIRYGVLGDPFSFIISGIHYFNGFGSNKNIWKNFSKRMLKGDVFPLLIFGGLFALLFPFTTLLNLLKFGDNVEIWCKKR